MIEVRVGLTRLRDAASTLSSTMNNINYNVQRTKHDQTLRYVYRVSHG